VIPVYSLLLVCVLPLQVHTRPRVHWASGIPHALQGGERFFNGSGAWRGEIVRVCLQTMRLFENEFGVGTERGAAIAPQTASVMPGLDPGIHQSSQQVFQRGWITGSSSAKTRFALLPGDDDLNGYDGLLWSSDTSVAARREKTDAAGDR
jgi:hypothetical protein